MNQNTKHIPIIQNNQDIFRYLGKWVADSNLSKDLLHWAF